MNAPVMVSLIAKMNYLEIEKVVGREILDSRGNLTVYKSLEQLLGFEDYGMQGRTYRYFSGDPLYEFGYGLSYTSFRYTNLQIPTRIATNDPIEFSVDVTNTGNMDGDEVVQVYSNT